jgi:hypothetical protein
MYIGLHSPYVSGSNLTTVLRKFRCIFFRYVLSITNYSKIFLYQTLSNVSAEIIASAKFITAVKETLAVELSISADTVTVAITMVAGRRKLLSNAILSYNIPVKDQDSADALSQKLGSVMETGSFFRTLQAKSGVPVSPASRLSIGVDEVTASPSSSLFTQSTVSSGKCTTHDTKRAHHTDHTERLFLTSMKWTTDV